MAAPTVNLGENSLANIRLAGFSSNFFTETMSKPIHSKISLSKQMLSELSQRASRKFKNRTAFEIYHDECTYNRVTYREFGKMTRQLASLLVSLGVKPADRVMIIAENRPEWAIAYFGIAQAGAVSVLVLIDFSCEQIKTIISHAEPSAICGTEKTMPKIAEALGNGASPDIPASIPVVCLDSIENTHKDTYTQKSEPDTSLLVSVGVARNGFFVR
jgi:long-subunit acyl-CoA synthetase (AMP-forming)